MKVLVALLVVLLVGLQYRLWFGNGSLQELWRVREEARATRAEVLALRSRNQALRAEVADLKSGLEAVEERARTDLGMVDEGETFYQFVRERDVLGRRVDDAGEALASRAVVRAPREGNTGLVEEAAEERPAMLEDAPSAGPGSPPGAVDTTGPIVRDAD